MCYLLFDYCYIHYASPPLRPIEGVRGIHPSNHLILNSEQDMYVCVLQVSFMPRPQLLGPL